MYILHAIFNKSLCKSISFSLLNFSWGGKTSQILGPASDTVSVKWEAVLTEGVLNILWHLKSHGIFS